MKDLMNKIVKSHCSSCRLRAYAEKRPQSFISKLWRWHAGWCPMNKAYQKSLQEQDQQAPPPAASQAT